MALQFFFLLCFYSCLLNRVLQRSDVGAKKRVNGGEVGCARESIIQKFALNFKIFARTDCQHACVQRAVQRRLEDHLNLASF